MQDKPKMLLVDDKLENIISLEKILSELDVEFVRALSGNEALKKTLENDFAIALIDVQMPDMDGYETAAFMRQEKKTENLPVIFISAIYSDDYYKIKGIETGAIDFIAKPVNPKILEGKIRVHLKLFRQNADLQESHDRLDLLVQERTAKLKSANEHLRLEIKERRQSEEELKQHKEHLEEIVRDRTKELENSNEQLKAVARELETFSYSISHDLKAPLRAICGYSGMLLEDYSGSLDKEGNRLLNVMNENAVQMGKLIEDILMYSRMGRKTLKKTEIDMKKLAEGIFSDLKKECPKRKIHFNVKTVRVCMGDSILMKQVLTNLISNAIKFTKIREDAAIEIGSRQVDGKETYYIKDNGIGFDMEYSKKPFELFHRLHSSKEYEGTGVGLAIAQRLVNRHGGKIWAEAARNEGATFYFTL